MTQWQSCVDECTLTSGGLHYGRGVGKKITSERFERTNLTYHTENTEDLFMRGIIYYIDKFATHIQR